MFLEDLLNSVRTRADLSLAAKWVLVELGQRQGSSRYCRVSYSYLAQRLNISLRAIKYAVAQLIEHRAITCKRRRIAADENEPNEYSVVWVNNHNRREAWRKRERESKQATG